MEPVQREILQQVEGTMRSEFISNLNRTAKRDNHEAMAEIFNSFDRQAEGRFMAQLDGKAHDSAERIKSLMFVFDDLARIDSTGIQVLLRAVDKRDLSVSLKGASETLTKLFFSNMSERGAKLLREEMQSLGPVSVKDVSAAQARIVAIAKELAAKNELMLSGQSAEDELIY
jgi:flagellar motor switch protein FliG